MNKEKRLLENEIQPSCLDAVMRSVVWQPTQLLRWKRVMKDEGSYDKVLQQMWQGDKGEQEWKDVPVEW